MLHTAAAVAAAAVVAELDAAPCEGAEEAARSSNCIQLQRLGNGQWAYARATITITTTNTTITTNTRTAMVSNQTRTCFAIRLKLILI